MELACRRFLKLKVRLSHQTAGGAEGLSVEASDAAATSRRLARTSRHLLVIANAARVADDSAPAVRASGRAFPRRLSPSGGGGSSLAAFSPGEARASGEVSAGDQTTPRLAGRAVNAAARSAPNPGVPARPPGVAA